MYSKDLSPRWYQESEFPIQFWIPGRVVPKARPRLGGRSSVFMPANYVQWKSECVHQIHQQLPGLRPIEQAVCIEAIVIGDRRGDLDNIVGSIMDALVDANLLQGDGISRVPRVTVEYRSHSKLKGAWITLTPFAIERFLPPGDLLKKIKKT